MTNEQKIDFDIKDECIMRPFSSMRNEFGTGYVYKMLEDDQSKMKLCVIIVSSLSSSVKNYYLSIPQTMLLIVIFSQWKKYNDSIMSFQYSFDRRVSYSNKSANIVTTYISAMIIISRAMIQIFEVSDIIYILSDAIGLSVSVLICVFIQYRIVHLNEWLINADSKLHMSTDRANMQVECLGVDSDDQEEANISGIEPINCESNRVCLIKTKIGSEDIGMGSGFFVKDLEKYYLVTCAHLFDKTPRALNNRFILKYSIDWSNNIFKRCHYNQIVLNKEDKIKVRKYWDNVEDRSNDYLKIEIDEEPSSYYDLSEQKGMPSNGQGAVIGFSNSYHFLWFTRQYQSDGVIELIGEEIRHTTNTSYGFSGGPISQDENLVGIHQGYVENKYNYGLKYK